MSVEQAARLLELPLPFTREQLRKAYLVALRVWHPDRFPQGDELHTLAKEKTRLIIEAHGILASALGQSDIYPSPPRREAVPPETHTTQTPPPSRPAVGKWSKLGIRLFQLVVMALLIPPISYYVLPYFGLHPAPLAGGKPAFVPPPPLVLPASQRPAPVQHPTLTVPDQEQAYSYSVVLDNGEKYQIDAYNELTQEQAYAGLIQNGNLANDSTRRIISMTLAPHAVASGQSSATPAPTSQVKAQVPNNAPVLLSDFDRLKARAEAGDDVAQLNLGLTYYEGGEVPKNDVEAVKWWRRSAGLGNASAQCNLGNAYANGYGVPKDEAEAEKWDRKAADQGDAMAQYNLGFAYNSGKGVPKDVVEAAKWFRKAADQGYASAQYNLGFACNSGEGVPKNFEEATNWFRKAAKQGMAKAQNSLAWCYVGGHGVPANNISALMLFHLAAAQGDEEGRKSFQWLQSTMTPAQIAEAEQLAKNFRPE